MIMHRNNRPPLDPSDPDNFLDLINSEASPLASMEEWQTFLGKIQTIHNNTPRKEFQGFSPAQMRQLLTESFSAYEIAHFHAPSAVGDVPFMRLYRILMEALRGRGLKATAKGNLPRNFCREAALEYYGQEKYADLTSPYGINNEEDFPELCMVRHVMREARLIHRQKGRWLATKNGLAHWDRDGLPGMFIPLLKVYVERCNWGVQDGFPDVYFLQRSFLFTLFLLARYGGEWRMDSFYSGLFLTAFPMLVRDFEPTPPIFAGSDRYFTLCYSVRVLDRFAAFWGLAETEEVFEDKGNYKMPIGRRVKRLPLLTDLVTFPDPVAGAK